jgi:hypothetical protein
LLDREQIRLFVRLFSIKKAALFHVMGAEGRNVMSIKKGLVLLADLLLVGMLTGLSGCGSNVGSGSTPASRPDSVRIQIDNQLPSQEKPVVTLTVARMVQQLYVTIYGLPQMPEFQSCTAVGGPHYLLTFRQGEKTLVTVMAERGGCRPVSLAGEAHDRQATDTFLAQLDQAIREATPPAKPQWLAIMHTLQTGQQPQTARLTSAPLTQRLYNAILTLPLITVQTCAPGALDYQFVFHAADQAIHSTVDKGCNTISLEGEYHSRSGLYAMNNQFKRLLSETLTAATFAPVRPDRLMLSFLDRKKMDTSQRMTIADTYLMQALYAKVLTLHPTQPQPGCPSEADKVANKGKWYDFSFSQWDLPILQFEVYEGSCTLIQIAATSRVLQGDQEFWNLVHRTASQS